MEEILGCLDEEILLEKFKKLYDDGDYEGCVTYIEKKLVSHRRVTVSHNLNSARKCFSKWLYSFTLHNT